MVWVGTERPIVPSPGKYFYKDPVGPEEAVRTQISSPCVTFVGSHEGCGFNSSYLAWQGCADEADLAPLVGALLDREREDYQQERASRERLHAIVVAARVDGPVIVHACWAGDEGLPPVAVKDVDPGWLLEKTSPLEEGVQYRVAADPSSTRREAAAQPAPNADESSLGVTNLTREL